MKQGGTRETLLQFGQTLNPGLWFVQVVSSESHGEVQEAVWG